MGILIFDLLRATHLGQVIHSIEGLICQSLRVLGIIAFKHAHQVVKDAIDELGVLEGLEKNLRKGKLSPNELGVMKEILGDEGFPVVSTDLDEIVHQAERLVLELPV